MPGKHGPDARRFSQARRLRVGLEVQAAERRLIRAADSAIVTYKRTDGLVAVLEGHGASLKARIADADAQLPCGEWQRVTVSTMASIHTDLRGRDLKMYAQSGVYPQYEGKWLTC